MIAIVVAAFLLSGLRKAGTPFDTASTPDSATAPNAIPLTVDTKQRYGPSEATS